MAFNQQMLRKFIPVLTQVETTAGDVFTWIPKKSIMVRDVSIVVTELCALDLTDSIASLDHTDTANGVGRAEKATFTLTEADAIGLELIASVNSGVAWVPFVVEAGDTLIFEHKQAGTDSGTPTGAFYFILYYDAISDGKS